MCRLLAWLAETSRAFISGVPQGQSVRGRGGLGLHPGSVWVPAVWQGFHWRHIPQGPKATEGQPLLQVPAQGGWAGTGCPQGQQSRSRPRTLCARHCCPCWKRGCHGVFKAQRRLVWCGPAPEHAPGRLSTGPSLTAGASCSWRAGAVSAGSVTGDQEGEQPSRSLRAGSRPPRGGASLASGALPVRAGAYPLSRESRTPEHTPRYKPRERGDFLPRGAPEHPLQAAFLHFKARSRPPCRAPAQRAPLHRRSACEPLDDPEVTTTDWARGTRELSRASSAVGTPNEASRKRTRHSSLNSGERFHIKH